MIAGPRISHLFGDDPRRIVLVGQAPGRDGDATAPCGSGFMRRLCAVSGLSVEQYADTFDRANILAWWPGPRVGVGVDGDAFPLADARAAAERLRPMLRGRIVVLAGRRVEHVLAERRGALFTPRAAGWCDVFFVIPHPSGLNRWWGCPENVAIAGDFVRALAAARRAS